MFGNRFYLGILRKTIRNIRRLHKSDYSARVGAPGYTRGGYGAITHRGVIQKRITRPPHTPDYATRVGKHRFFSDGIYYAVAYVYVLYSDFYIPVRNSEYAYRAARVQIVSIAAVPFAVRPARHVQVFNGRAV